MREGKLIKLQNIGKIGYILTIIAFCLMIAITVIYSALGVGLNVVKIPVEDIKIDNNTVVDVKIKDGIDIDKVKKAIEELVIDKDDIGELNSKGIEKRADGNYATFEGNVKKNYSLESIRKALIIPGISLIISLINIYFLSRIFKNLRDSSTPFTSKMVSSMYRFAFSMVPWIFLQNVSSALLSAFKLTDNLELGVDATALVTVAFVIVLARIFDYGVDLQTESDDTV